MGGYARKADRGCSSARKLADEVNAYRSIGGTFHPTLPDGLAGRYVPQLKTVAMRMTSATQPFGTPVVSRRPNVASPLAAQPDPRAMPHSSNIATLAIAPSGHPVTATLPRVPQSGTMPCSARTVFRPIPGKDKTEHWLVARSRIPVPAEVAAEEISSLSRKEACARIVKLATTTSGGPIPAERLRRMGQAVQARVRANRASPQQHVAVVRLPAQQRGWSGLAWAGSGLAVAAGLVLGVMLSRWDRAAAPDAAATGSSIVITASPSAVISLIPATDPHPALLQKEATEIPEAPMPVSLSVPSRVPSKSTGPVGSAGVLQHRAVNPDEQAFSRLYPPGYKPFVAFGSGRRPATSPATQAPSSLVPRTQAPSVHMPAPMKRSF